ncbi:MAG: hypothetical protein DSY81_01530 [Bacillota bacterium]|nr:MAG: hypothetical protein DSY92_11550 [Planctomycetota bacterium]RUA11095.1 MAG: hypothetical protein DSY81_01530 [Bacillota bacterium]
MTAEKHPQDRDDVLENTQANSQEKRGFFSAPKWRNEALRQKSYPYVAAGLCVWFFAADLIYEWWVDRPVDSMTDWESNGALLVMCFLIMGACVKEQHDRIQKLEASLAARDENPAR